jgi:hypothetical protein
MAFMVFRVELGRRAVFSRREVDKSAYFSFSLLDSRPLPKVVFSVLVTYGPCSTVTAELSEQHRPVVSQHSATLSAYNAATCLRHASPCLMTLQWAATTPHTSGRVLRRPGSILLPFPSLLYLPPRRVLKHSHESLSSLSYFLLSLLGSIRLAAGSVIMFGFFTTLCS